MDLEIQEFCMGELAVIHIGQLGPQGALASGNREDPDISRQS
jgi:hypothetical protein